MIHVVCYDAQGKITQAFSAPFDSLQDIPLLPEAAGGYLCVDSPVNMSDLYVENGRLVAIPARPGPHHFFDYESKTWQQDIAAAWRDVRSTRNALLASSDWTQLPDVPIATKEAWAAYRQTLRDLTLQPDPTNIVWPQPPTEA